MFFYFLKIFFNNKLQKFSVAFRKRNVWKIGTPFGRLACQVEISARRFVRWHAKRQVEALARRMARWHAGK